MEGGHPRRGCGVQNTVQETLITQETQSQYCKPLSPKKFKKTLNTLKYICYTYD